jgi:hypothetical protein
LNNQPRRDGEGGGWAPAVALLRSIDRLSLRRAEV